MNCKLSYSLQKSDKHSLLPQAQHFSKHFVCLVSRFNLNNTYETSNSHIEMSAIILFVELKAAPALISFWLTFPENQTYDSRLNTIKPTELHNLHAWTDPS